jgi:hypothetical protein
MAVTRSQAKAKPITQAAINPMLPFPSGSRNIDIVTILYGLHTICAARLVAISRLSSSAPLYVKTGGIRKKIIQSKAVGRDVEKDQVSEMDDERERWRDSSSSVMGAYASDSLTISRE